MKAPDHGVHLLQNVLVLMDDLQSHVAHRRIAGSRGQANSGWICLP